MESFMQIGLEMGLTVLKDNQQKFLEKLDHLNTDPDTLARYGLALQIEVSEFVNELPWKVWKLKTMKPDRIVDEFADVLAFIGTWVNLLNLMGITPGLLALAYAEKTRVNQERILKGTVPGYGNPTDGYAADEGSESRIQAAVDSIYTRESVRGSNGYAQTPLPPEATLEVRRSLFDEPPRRPQESTDSPPELPNLALVARAFPPAAPYGLQSGTQPNVPRARPIPDVMDLAGGLEEDTELDPLYDSVAPLDDDDEDIL